MNRDAIDAWCTGLAGRRPATTTYYRGILLVLAYFVFDLSISPLTTVADYFDGAFAPKLPMNTPPATRAAYESAIRLFDEFLGRPGLLSDFKPETAATFIKWLNARSKAAGMTTVPRDCLVKIWSLASSRGFACATPAAGTLPRAKVPSDIPPASEPSLAEKSNAPGQDGCLDPELPLIRYLETFRAPLATKTGNGARVLHETGIAIRWLDAFLKRSPTLADLSGLTASPAKPVKLMQFIVAHGRMASTARITAERLFALWRAIVFAGHMPSSGKQPKLPAPKRLKPRETRASRYSPVPTVEALERGAAIKKAAPMAGPVPANPATPETTLLDFLMNYYIVERPIAQSTIDNGYKSTISSFSRFLERPAKIADLTAPQINAWIVHMEGQVGPRTVATNRRQLLTFWRFAFETEVRNDLPRRIRKVKLPRLIVEGWDSEQIGKLLAAADEMETSFYETGIERRLWWRAFLLTAWFTGLRLGDILSIEFESIAPMPDGTGRLTVVMSKTGDSINRVLPAETMEAIRACMASGRPRALCFPLWVCRRSFSSEAKLLIKAAGLTGSLKWIRRGSASEAEKVKAGAGRMHLGHRTVGLFESNYRCDRITQQEITLPPSPSFKPTLRIEHKPHAGKAGAP
ncbi:MAG TPA: hypothetical protein VHX65_19815 [Pirellulales bacterium]|nr:hypothetical protein [Pirellulales bacterium]